jgi:hypothetical protein
LLLRLLESNAFRFAGEPLLLSAAVVAVKLQIARQKDDFNPAHVFSVWIELMAVSVMKLLVHASEIALHARHLPPMEAEELASIRNTLDERMFSACGFALAVGIAMWWIAGLAATGQQRRFPRFWEHVFPHLATAATLGAILLFVAKPLP